MKKNFKVRNFVAIIMVTAMATAVFAGCSTANDERKESAVVSIVEDESKESSVEESEETSEVSLQESSEESEEVSEQESSKESEIVSEQESVESSNVEEASIQESSVTEIEEESSEVEIRTASLDDVIAYGEFTDLVLINIPGDEFPCQFTPGLRICILNKNDNSYDFYCEGKIATVDSSYIKLYPDDYVPDFSENLWVGLE